MTRVFPLPAPARTRSGPSVRATASRWAGLRRARSGSVTVALAPPVASTASVRAEPVSEREERRLAVAVVEGLLGHGGGPADGKLAGERGVPEQDVRDPRALGAGQPGGHEGRRLGE